MRLAVQVDIDHALHDFINRPADHYGFDARDMVMNDAPGLRGGGFNNPGLWKREKPLYVVNAAKENRLLMSAGPILVAEKFRYPCCP